MFSKTPCSLAECALALSLGRARHCRRGNRCSRARHAPLYASARRLDGIANNRRFSRRLALAFDRSNYAAAMLVERLSIFRMEQKLAGSSRKMFALVRRSFDRARAQA